MNKDARDALESLNNFEPDLIITDILMPFTSGLEFIGIIRSSGIKPYSCFICYGPGVDHCLKHCPSVQTTSLQNLSSLTNFLPELKHS